MEEFEKAKTNNSPLPPTPPQTVLSRHFTIREAERDRTKAEGVF